MNKEIINKEYENKPLRLFNVDNRKFQGEEICIKNRRYNNRKL